MGGNFADKNEFPWAALLEIRSKKWKGHVVEAVKCGGSLISDRLGD